MFFGISTYIYKMIKQITHFIHPECSTILELSCVFSPELCHAQGRYAKNSSTSAIARITTGGKYRLRS